VAKVGGAYPAKKQTFAKRQAGCRKTYIYAGYTGRHEAK
jgi:hypothetical protein